MLDVIIDDQFIRLGESFALALDRTLRIPPVAAQFPSPYVFQHTLQEVIHV